MKRTKKAGSIDFTVGVDRYELTLKRGDVVLGHYNTVEGLLRAAQIHAVRTKTKSGLDLSTFITSILGLQQELKDMTKKFAFLAEKKIAKFALDLQKEGKQTIPLQDYLLDREARASVALDGETQSA